MNCNDCVYGDKTIDTHEQPCEACPDRIDIILGSIKNLIREDMHKLVRMGDRNRTEGHVRSLAIIDWYVKEQGG